MAMDHKERIALKRRIASLLNQYTKRCYEVHKIDCGVCELRKRCDKNRTGVV